MTRTARFAIAAAVFLTFTGAGAAPASAQVVHSFQAGLGGFFPRGFDSRIGEDVLLRNFVGQSLPALPSRTDSLIFDMRDFRSGHGFAEWNIAFGPHIEASAGIGFHGRTVPTLYRDLVETIDDVDFDIVQDIKLRVVPITGMVRFLPFGDFNTVQPYVGAGLSLMRFRYSEIGSFVDPSTLEIFDDRFVATGSAVGPMLVGGVRVPLGGDIYAMTLEGRYQYGNGKTGGADKGFVADKIDLSGGVFNVGFLIRF